MSTNRVAPLGDSGSEVGVRPSSSPSPPRGSTPRPAGRKGFAAPLRAPCPRRPGARWQSPATVRRRGSGEGPQTSGDTDHLARQGPRVVLRTGGVTGRGHGAEVVGELEGDGGCVVDTGKAAVEHEEPFPHPGSGGGRSDRLTRSTD